MRRLRALCQRSTCVVHASTQRTLDEEEILGLDERDVQLAALLQLVHEHDTGHTAADDHNLAASAVSGHAAAFKFQVADAAEG